MLGGSGAWPPVARFALQEREYRGAWLASQLFAPAPLLCQQWLAEIEIGCPGEDDNPSLERRLAAVFGATRGLVAAIYVQGAQVLVAEVLLVGRRGLL